MILIYMNNFICICIYLLRFNEYTRMYKLWIEIGCPETSRLPRSEDQNEKCLITIGLSTQIKATRVDKIYVILKHCYPNVIMKDDSTSSITFDVLCEVRNLWTHQSTVATATITVEPKTNVDDTIAYCVPLPIRPAQNTIRQSIDNKRKAHAQKRLHIKHRLWSLWSWGFEEYFLFWKTSENMLQTNIVNLLLGPVFVSFVPIFTMVVLNETQRKFGCTITSSWLHWRFMKANLEFQSELWSSDRSANISFNFLGNRFHKN